MAWRLVKSMCSSVLNWNFTNVIKIIQMLYKIIFPALKWCRHMTYCRPGKLLKMHRYKISKENCIPIFLWPYPPIKCWTRQIWPTLSWKSYFFIIFFLKKIKILVSGLISGSKRPKSNIILTSACPQPHPK